MTEAAADRPAAGPRPPGVVAIIGLGLMGGSLARDLVAAGSEVLVHDARPDAAASAAQRLSASVLGPDFAGLERAEQVVIATPVDTVPHLLDLVAPRLSSRATVTDVGSTKDSICRYAQETAVRDRFVGSHPLVGDHRSGWDASRSGLFRSGRVFVCPTSATAPEHLDRVLQLWTAVGGRCEILNPAEHDRRMAWTSHLPQIVSSALARTLDEQGLTLSELGPGGRDVVRLAGSAPEVWSAIVLDNAENLDVATDELVRALRGLQQALRNRDSGEISTFFRRSRAWHEAVDG